MRKQELQRPPRSNSPPQSKNSTSASQGSFSRQHQVAQPEASKCSEPRDPVFSRIAPYSLEQKPEKSTSIELNWSRKTSEKNDSNITKNGKSTSGKQKKNKKWSRTISEDDPHITIDECTDTDIEEKEHIKKILPDAIETITDKELRDFTDQKFKGGKGNLSFAKYDIDGQKDTIHSLSGEANMEGFAKYLPDDRRKFKTIEAGGFNRKADTEAKILEQIFSQTTENSTGTIRLFTQLPVCKSCGGVIEQFTEERPNIKIKVVEEKS